MYASLVGGARAKFISGDMMRQHAHLLGPQLKAVFQRWQQKHQYDIEFHGREGVTFDIKPSIQFNIHGHRHLGVWHIPFLEQYEHQIPDLYAYNMPAMWACFKLE